jgi:hypothetical protein
LTIPRFYSEPNQVYEDRDFAVAEISFLITNHLLGRPAPFPIPPGTPRAASEAIATIGFSQYGRRAQFAAFVKPEPDDFNREKLPPHP